MAPPSSRSAPMAMAPPPPCPRARRTAPPAPTPPSSSARPPRRQLRPPAPAPTSSVAPVLRPPPRPRARPRGRRPRPRGRSRDGVEMGWSGPLDLSGPLRPASEGNIPLRVQPNPYQTSNQTRVQLGWTRPNPPRPSNQTHPTRTRPTNHLRISIH